MQLWEGNCEAVRFSERLKVGMALSVLSQQVSLGIGEQGNTMYSEQLCSEDHLAISLRFFLSVCKRHSIFTEIERVVGEEIFLCLK